MTAKLLILPGDGIGPEIVREAEKVLLALRDRHGLDVAWEHGLIGGAAYDAHGEPLPAATLEKARAADAVLFGAIGGPQYDTLPKDKRPERGLLGIRAAMGFYANLRPAILYPQLANASSLKPELVAGLDILIVRELTGGIYFGKRESRVVDGYQLGHEVIPQARVASDVEQYSDYEIARVRLESLEASIREAVTQSQTTNQAQVQLRGLESASQSYRALYDSFLQRYMESVQQQSFPLTEARLVTKATPPSRKSQPRGALTLLGAIIAGGMLGFGIAWLREVTDKTLRTPAEVEGLLGSTCIASVPALDTAGGPDSADRLREVVEKPISRFAEAIRTIKVAADFYPASRRSQIIGIVSSIPGEGKTTIAANFAELVAQSGASAVLIDGDLRNPSLTTRLFPKAKSGLVELLSGQSLLDVMVKTADGRLDFIPALKTASSFNSNEYISSAKMNDLLQALKSRYDYVIVDLPPLLPVIDARAAAELIDGFIFVVEWGATSSETVERAFQLSSRIQNKMIGVALNKVDQRTAEHYYSYEYGGGKSAYYS